MNLVGRLTVHERPTIWPVKQPPIFALSSLKSMQCNNTSMTYYARARWPSATTKLQAAAAAKLARLPAASLLEFLWTAKL